MPVKNVSKQNEMYQYFEFLLEMLFVVFQDSVCRIKQALTWYRSHNHLYSSFYSNYETLFRYVKPQFGCINPELLAKSNLSLEQILEDEAAGMAFPVDARFFDNYQLVFDKEDDVAGRQYPHEHSECQKRMKELVSTYCEKNLGTKNFPIYSLGVLEGGITTVQ